MALFSYDQQTAKTYPFVSKAEYSLPRGNEGHDFIWNRKKPKQNKANKKNQIVSSSLTQLS